MSKREPLRSIEFLTGEAWGADPNEPSGRIYRKAGQEGRGRVWVTSSGECYQEGKSDEWHLCDSLEDALGTDLQTEATSLPLH